MLYNFFFQTKVVTNHSTELLVQFFFFFLLPHGFGLCPDCPIRFFSEKCLKSALYKNVFWTKFVTDQKPQLLLIFFNTLHHFGVVAGFQIFSVCVSRKYCAVLGNRLFYAQPPLRSTYFLSLRCVYDRKWEFLKLAKLFICINIIIFL